MGGLSALHHHDAGTGSRDAATPTAAATAAGSANKLTAHLSKLLHSQTADSSQRPGQQYSIVDYLPTTPFVSSYTPSQVYAATRQYLFRTDSQETMVAADNTHAARDDEHVAEERQTKHSLSAMLNKLSVSTKVTTADAASLDTANAKMANDTLITLLSIYDPAKVAKINGQYRYSLRCRTGWFRRSSCGTEVIDMEVLPLDASTGIAGTNRRQVIRELARLRKSGASAQRMRRAAVAGLATIIVIAATTYMFICDVISVVRLLAPTRSQQDILRNSFLIGTLIGRAITLCGEGAVFLWCRYARRPGPLVRTIATVGGLCVFLHISLAIINLCLVLSWQDTVIPERNSKTRCEWGVDLLWMLGDAGAYCSTQTGSGDLIPWIAAGSVRLIVVVMVGAFWYHLIVQLNHSLSVASIYDPAKVADTYLTALLSKDSIQVVDLNDIRLVRRTAIDPSAKEYLPPMPEEEDGDEGADDTAKPGGWTGMFWNAVGWLFGTSAYEGVKERPESCYNKGVTGQSAFAVNLEQPIDGYSGQQLSDETTLAGDSASTRKSNRTAAAEGHFWNPFDLLGRWLFGETSEVAQARDLEKTAMLLSNAPPTPNRSRVYQDECGCHYTGPFAGDPLHSDVHSPSRKRPLSENSEVTMRAPARASLDDGPSIQFSRLAPSLLAHQQVFRGLPQLPDEDFDRMRALSQLQQSAPAVPPRVLYDPYRNAEDSFSDYDDFVRRYVAQAHCDSRLPEPSNGQNEIRADYGRPLGGKLSAIHSESDRFSSRHASQASLAALTQRQAHYRPAS